MPHVLLECKRPVSNGGETSSIINFLTRYKQLINYASQILFKYLEITLPPIILTGRHIVRLDSFSMPGEVWAPDFRLFWNMCNYVSPKGPLDVQWSREGQQLLYEQRDALAMESRHLSMVRDYANEQCPGSLYRDLKAIGDRT